VRNIQTLHAHTKNSDGELSHLEVLNACEQNDIAVVAFTDHDSLIDEISLKKLRNYEGKTKWVSGIEISSGLPKELGGTVSSNFHIVGLFVDPTNKALKNHCKLAKEARITRMQKMVGNLQSIGFDITEKDCLKASGGESVGRPHVVKALTSKESNIKVLEQLRQKMEKEAETNPKVKKEYDAMMERGEGQYPYVLFLSDDSFIPNIYVGYKYFLDMDSTVKLIRDAGGVAILAHYFSIIKKVDEGMLDEMLKNNRFDGLKTTFGLFVLGSGTKQEEMVKNSVEIARNLVEKHNKLKSGGADAHRLQQFVDFSNSGEYANETIGFAEQIMDKMDVDKKWSNF